MSQLLRDIPITSLRHIVNSGLVEVCEDKKNGKLSNTQMVERVQICVPDKPDVPTDFIPRIPLATLDRLLKDSSKSLRAKSAATISTLYEVGLGVPRDTRLYNLWSMFSTLQQPTIKNKPIKYENILFAFKEHVQKAHDRSPDGINSYMNLIQDHFDKFEDATIISSIEDIQESIDLNESANCYTVPKLQGAEMLLVYLNSGTEYTLYGAFFVKIKKLVPIVRQAQIIKSIPGKIAVDKKVFPSSLGRFVCIRGKFVIPESCVETLCELHNVTSYASLLNLVMSQDIHAFNSKNTILPQTSLVAAAHRVLFDVKKIEKAKEILIKASGMKKLPDKAKLAVKKSKAFLETVEDAEKTIADHEAYEKTWRKQADIVKQSVFYAYDMVRVNPSLEMCNIKAPYKAILSRLGLAGFNVLPCRKVSNEKAPNLNTVKYSVEDANVVGTMVRAFDVPFSGSVSASMTWFKI